MEHGYRNSECQLQALTATRLFASSEFSCSAEMSRSHGYPTTQEEEDMALALAISASLTEDRAPLPRRAAAASTTLQVHSKSKSRPQLPQVVASHTSAPPAPSYSTTPHNRPTYPNSFTRGSIHSNGSPPASSYQNGSAVPSSRPPASRSTSSSLPTPLPTLSHPTHSPPHIPRQQADNRSTSAPPRRLSPWMPPTNLSGDAVVHLPPQRSVSPPPRARPGAPSQSGSQPQHRTLHATGCAGCGRTLYGTYINALGRRWHAECFTCAFCSRPIGFGGNIEFAVGRDDNWPYHLDCHRHKYHPVCHVCQAFIPERTDGRIEFKENPFWREKYCPNHQQDGTPQCCSCSRFKPQADAEWVQLNDARHLCLECLGSMLVDTKDAQPLYEQVLHFYRSMNMTLPEKPPLFLVDGHVLNEYSSREGGRADGPIFHVRGLTLADIYRSIPTVRRVGGRNWFDVDSVSTSVVRTKCVVTGILIMYGLPRLLTGCIMAHELMHAWLRMANVTGLDLQVEEGLCQLVALLWLDRQGGPNSRKDQVQERLASYFAFQIRSDPSPVYGEGFRIAFEVFQKYQGDLKRIVQAVISTGRLPP